jgi:DNA-directed RNA polymerase II subunit RPB4
LSAHSLVRAFSAHPLFVAELTVDNIGSLCCETAEEAKTLIPSLTDKISDEDLQELLDEMYKLMPN